MFIHIVFTFDYLIKLNNKVHFIQFLKNLQILFKMYEQINIFIFNFECVKKKNEKQ